MGIEDIIKKYKKQIDKAQIAALREKAEHYKNVMADKRSEAYRAMRSNNAQARRALQNYGLASRNGRFVTGIEQSRAMGAQRVYSEYSNALDAATKGYVERDAAKMAYEGEVAKNIEKFKEAQAKNDEEAEKIRKEWEEYMRKLAALQAQQNQKPPQTDPLQQAANQANPHNTPLWHQAMTDSGNSSSKPTGKIPNLPPLKQKLPNQTEYQTVVQNLTSNWGVPKRDAVAHTLQQKQQEAARLNAQAAFNEQQALYAKIQRAEGIAKPTNRNEYEIWRDAQNAQAKLNEQAQYAENMQKWQKTIDQAANITKPTNRYENEALKEAERARQQMAKAQADMARKEMASKVTGMAGALLQLSDDDFKLRYDAAERAYKLALQNAKILRQDSSSSMDDLSSDADRMEAQATQNFAAFEQANALREQVSEDNLYWNTFKPDAHNEYNKPSVRLIGNLNKESDLPPIRTQDYLNAVKEYNPQAYNKMHDTDSKYAAAIHEYGRLGVLDSMNVSDQARDLLNYDETFLGKALRNSYADAYDVAMALVMTDEERNRFDSFLANGQDDKADKYFEYLRDSGILDARAMQLMGNRLQAGIKDEIEKNGKLGLILSTLWTIPANVANGLIQPIASMFDTNVTPYQATIRDLPNVMREAVSQNLSSAGAFAYQTGMSIGDSLMSMALGGRMGGIALGGSAYNAAYREAVNSGKSTEEARLTAFGTGVNEMLFETLSIGTLLDATGKSAIKASKNAFVNWLVNTAVQAGVEGSEEVFTDIANNTWDKVVNGIYSDELTKLREYMTQGMSFDDAKAKVAKENGQQLAMSFLGGALSGGVMGGAAGAMHNIQMSDYERIGNNMDAATKAELDNFKFTDEQAREIQQQSKKTNQDYGMLAVIRAQETMQTDPTNAYKAVQSILDTQARTDLKVDKRNQTLKTGTENSVSFNYDGVTDVKQMSGVQVEALRFAQTLVKSKVGGVNINVANQLYDKNGNEQNGWYDPKTNTVHVSLNGSQSVVYTISHELTHRLKEGNKEAYASLRDAMKSELESLDLLGSDLPEDYSDILGDYLVKDGVQRTAWDALVDYEMDRYAKHGITLDRESAEEEVVCRACETMLERSRLISSMVSRNVRGAKKIAKFLASVYDDIASLKEEAESRGYVDGSPEKLFIDQYTDVEKIANAWANAMKTVSQDTTKKIVKEEGRGGTAFSLKQELRDDGQSLADRSMKYRKAHKAESQHISDEMLEAANKQIHRMAQRMLPFLTLKNKKGMTYLPDEVLGKTRFGNSSYGGTSIENTTICFRTLAYIDFTNEIKKQIGRPLTVSESFLASQMLYQIAKEPQCLYCYVSLDRKAYDEQLLSYIKQRDKVVEGFNKLSLDERQAITKATRNPSKAFGVDIPLYTEFLAKRKDTPQMRTRFAQWIDIANSGSEAITAADLATDERRGLMRNGDDWQETKRAAGKVSLQDQVIDAERYAQSASWAKKMEEYRAYNGDILKIGKRTVNKLNNEYGLRFYSFSEYSPAFIVENMQQIRDAALKGLMGLAYTKKTDFARIFAGTGMNINVSTFGRWGVDADGNRVVVMDSDQGADWTEVQNLRKQYENVGAVFVATDDAMTEWAIKQDWIDVVIPFHIVRTGANVAEFYKWVVHNSEQNDVTAEGKNATIPAAEHGNSYEKYMSLVNERGLTPRFDKWRPENNPNVTADEYMKLVNETRRTLDATNPLQPIYDTREAARSFAAFVHDGGYYGDYYKAKSEQDIKVPVTPEQDILGIGSKTYTEQEGIDRVVADIKAGNKANQVPYGRQDIDEQISRLNKARQVKQHGQKFSIKESDAQYLDLARRYESGDKSVEAELRKAVDDAARAAGAATLTNGKVKKYYHGTRDDFTIFDIDKARRGTYGYGFYVTAIKDVASHYVPKNGRLLPLYLMTDKLATRDDHRITEEMVSEIVQAYDIPGDLFHEQTISQLVSNESDAEIIRRLENYIDDETTVKPSVYLNAFREVFGYDGLRMPGENIVWSNDLLKSAELITYDKDGNIIPLSERFKTDRTGEDAWKNEDIRYSLKEGEERAIKIADGKTKDGETVSFIDRILDGEKTGETRMTRASIKPNAWVGIYKDGKVYGRVKFGDPMWITKQSKEYKTSYIKDTNYDIDDSVGGKWYYPVLEVQDFRGNPIPTNRAGQWGAAYNVPKNNDTRYSLKDDVRLSTDRATLAGQMHEGAKGARALRAQAEKYNERIDELNGRIGKLNKRIAELKTQMDDVSLAERMHEGATREQAMRELKEKHASAIEEQKTARAEDRAKARKAIESARLAERMHQGAEDAAELRKVRDEYNERIAQRDRLLEQVRKQRDAAKQHAVDVRKQERAARVRRDIVAVLKRGNDRIVKLLANPTENSHVPVQLAQAVAEYAQRLNELLTTSVPMSGENAGIEKQTKKGVLNAQKIIDAYNRSFADEETISLAKAENPNFNPRGLLPSSDYDETLVKMINAMDSIVKNKHISDLTTEELRFIMTTMRGVIHTVQDANKLIGTTERKAIWQVGSKMVNELETAPKVSQKLRGYLETSLDLRRLAKIFSGSNENAEFVKLVDQLNQGAIEKERIAQTLQDTFKAVTDEYGDEIRKWYGKNAEWIDTGITKNGKKVEITKGMRVSLAMHVLNEGNMRHIENGGLTIPNREMYRKGNLADAYANGELVRLNADQINEIISHMTDAEKAYVEAAKELFHKRTGYFVNKTSLALLGYRKATVENYFPIHTDKNFTKTDFASLKMDGSIEGQGFLKERVNASNPVYLEDITSVVNRQIRGVALYAGLAIPMRNFNAVTNTSVYEDDNGVWSPRTTVKQTMTQKMGDYGRKVVEGFLSDVSEMSHVDVTPMERFAGKLATNYVKAVLLGNLKVAMKQTASYPTAAAVIPWKYLGKALLAGGRNSRMISRADVDLINQYTPLYQMRREGQANEIASVMQKRGIEQKLPWLLGWITKMDVMTVGRLWSAAEYMVADRQKNLPVGSDAYYKAVAKVFNDTIQQTQPNFTPLQRNAALRSKNPVVRSLVLFGTQRMQNGGILMEAAYELKQSKGKSKAEIKAAKMKLGRAVASQIVQNILLIVASLGVDALRGRMKGWQDDDKDITPESMAKGMSDMFLSNFIGSFLGGSEVYNLVSALYKKATGETAYDAEFTVPALDAAETLMNFVQDLPDVVKYLTGDHTDEEKLKKAKNFSFDLAKAFGYATGIPLENAVKDLFKGIIPAIQDLKDAKKTGELNLWLHQSGKIDSKKTAANYKEWTNDGKKGSVYLYWDKKLKDITGGYEAKAQALFEDSTLSTGDKAMLLRMLLGGDGWTSKGPCVYNANGEIKMDFTNLDTFRVSQLSSAKYEGMKQAIAMGVPEDYAATAFIKYTELKKDGAGANDRFREWLQTVVKDAEQRSILEQCVLGNDSDIKRAEYSKKLISTGMNKEKAYVLTEIVRNVKKNDVDEYLQGLTDEQTKLIFEWKGWKWK